MTLFITLYALHFVCWNAMQSCVPVANSSQVQEGINTDFIWRIKKTKHEAMLSRDMIQGKITGNALFLGSETMVKWYNECLFPWKDHLTWRFFLFFFFSMFTVQEDAEPGAQSLVWDESLRQPSVRVHLQHLPRWAVRHIFTNKCQHIHTHWSIRMPYHICMWQRLRGYPKHLLNSWETHGWCALLLLNQFDLVWRGETESPPRSDCREIWEGGRWGMDQGQWGTVPSGSHRHCIIHQEDSPAVFCDSQLSRQTARLPLRFSVQLATGTKSDSAAYQGCVHTDVPACASKRTSVFSSQRSKILKGRGAMGARWQRST